MSRDQDQDAAPIEDLDQLIDYFRAGSKPDAKRGVGTEHEKFLFRQDATPVGFSEDGGIEDIFGQLQERFDWEPQYDRGHVVALVRGSEAITLEPGGQFELSGAVTKTIFETRDEFDRHLGELAQTLRDDYRSVMFGMNPWDSPETREWVPKARYGVMRRYLAGQGDMSHWMMKTTCTIQANLDYRSEEDAVEIIRMAALASPIVNALFANSPLTEGKPNGYQSMRGHIWTRTDNDRAGVPDFFYRDDWGFAEWLDWVLDVPMFFIRRPDGYIDKSGDSFREFMKTGYEGTPATMGDFELHLSTVFPEVRMKSFIEVRSADGGPRDHVFALSALWKGVTYDDAARRDVLAMFDGTTPDEHLPFYAIAAKDGIHGEWNGRSVLSMAGDLVAIASDGLDRIAERDGHPSEAEFLSPLRDIVETATSAADQLLADFDRYDGNPGPILRARDLFARHRE